MISSKIQRKSAPVTILIGTEKKMGIMFSSMEKLFNYVRSSSMVTEKNLTKMLLEKQISSVDYQSLKIFEFIRSARFISFPNIFLAIKYGKDYKIQGTQIVDEEDISKITVIEDEQISHDLIKFTACCRMITEQGWGVIQNFAFGTIGQDPQDFTLSLLTKFDRQFFSQHLIFAGLGPLCHCCCQSDLIQAFNSLNSKPFIFSQLEMIDLPLYAPSIEQNCLPQKVCSNSLISICIRLIGSEHKN